jgi:hypothetical protein
MKDLLQMLSDVFSVAFSSFPTSSALSIFSVLININQGARIA